MTFFPVQPGQIFPTGPLLSVRKAALESRDNTATYVDDSELVLSAIPAGRYRLTCILYCRYRLAAGFKIRLKGTNFGALSPLVDHSMWEEGSSVLTPTDIPVRLMYPSATDECERDIAADTLSPPAIYKLRLGMTNGDIVSFSGVGTLGVQWAQSTATVGSEATIFAGSVLALSRAF
jgi:hypothetical protein